MGLKPPYTSLPRRVRSAGAARRSASGGRGLSFGAYGAFAPLAGLSPAPAADAAGRVKSRRPDWLKSKPHTELRCGAFSSSRPV